MNCSQCLLLQITIISHSAVGFIFVHFSASFNYFILRYFTPTSLQLQIMKSASNT